MCGAARLLDPAVDPAHLDLEPGDTLPQPLISKHSTIF
jgi:hypothetical protein